MKITFHSLFTCVALGISCSASAAPVTYDFTGILTSHLDFTTMKSVLDNSQVTGSVTFEILDPKAYGWPDGMKRYQSHSESGCYLMRNGACVVQSLTAAPVVTSMVFKGSFGTYTIDANDMGATFEGIVDRDANRPASYGSAQWAEYDIINDYANDEGDSHTRWYEFGQLRFQGDSLFQDISDLAGAINLAGAIADFNYSSSYGTQACTASACAPYVFPTGAGTQMRLNGTITSFTLHQDAAEVPEPATLLLVAGGVFGMRARRRRA